MAIEPKRHRVDPQKPRTVLIVHGVQLGGDKDQTQNQQIKENIESRLGGLPLDFKAIMYKYEGVNDKAQEKWKWLLRLIASGPVGIVSEKALDLIGDVVTAHLNTSTAHEIREGLKHKILDIYESGSPCYLVAHSLGSIYAFDVVNGLMRNKDLFDRQSRRTWPVQGLVTLGSPIGLGLFKKGRSRISKLGEGSKWFRWLNYWDRTDPVVSGSIFGKHLPDYEIAEKYRNKSPDQGWVIRDKPVDTGKVWLRAHVAYWDHPVVGDGLADLITN